MLHAFIIILSFYSLTFAFKESYLFDKPRIWLIGKSTFFYHLFECYFCVGFHSGYIVYLLANPFHSWALDTAFLWGLAGAATSYIGNLIVGKLS